MSAFQINSVAREWVLRSVRSCSPLAVTRPRWSWASPHFLWTWRSVLLFDAIKVHRLSQRNRVMVCINYKKLNRRWDNESELSLRPHRTLGPFNVSILPWKTDHSKSKDKKLIRGWDSERELSLRRGKTTVLDRHQIRLRVRVSSKVSLAVRNGSLFSRQHRARSTKYNWLVHKFRHRSTRLCVGTSLLNSVTK